MQVKGAGFVAAAGMLALFENNPWNPGARMVMARIPFDRDAVTLSPIEARRMLRIKRLVDEHFVFLFDVVPRMRNTAWVPCTRKAEVCRRTLARPWSGTSKRPNKTKSEHNFT
jgi:hypothetical protein